MTKTEVLFYNPIITAIVVGVFLQAWSHWVGRKGHVLVTGILLMFPAITQPQTRVLGRLQEHQPTELFKWSGNNILQKLSLH